MADFSSALYLGLHHPTDVLVPWEQFSTGKPAALEVPEIQKRVEQSLARLAGCERASLGSSTLHLFGDLLPMLAGRGMEIYLDAGTYPIAVWGAHRAGNGVTHRRFAHYDPESLERSMKKTASLHPRPVVVADGFCPRCGRPAPVTQLLRVARARAGFLVLDDTQALGILGQGPEPARPYGQGGGGSLAFHGVGGDDLVLVSSLAKGFGVPVAVLAGSRSFVDWFESNSLTRVHCSPPCIPASHAVAHALLANARHGDALRQHLAALVHRFRDGLATIGIPTQGGLFPVQTILTPHGLDAAAIHEALLSQGIRTVLHPARRRGDARISFLISARHGPADIDQALAGLALILHRHQRTYAHGETSYDTFMAS